MRRESVEESMNTNDRSPPQGAPDGTVWFGGPVDSASVSLRIFGEDVDPVEISMLLGCEPTEAARTGETLTRPNGRTRMVSMGFWSLSSDRQATDLADQIESLLAKLTNDAAVWQSLTERFDVDLFCGLFLETTNRGVSLPAHLMTALGERGLRIGFDIYAPEI
jgi:hypothetical protein